MTEQPQVICAKCKVALVPLEDPNPENRLACPQCGTEDTYDNVMGEVRQFMLEQARGEIQKGLAKTARGSKTLTFTPSRSPKRTYRFIVR